MARKKWTKNPDETPSLIKLREKRKWQINLRRYVLLQNACVPYAPYFGLDSKRMRQWFEYQFEGDIDWNNFGIKWQFGHVIPVAYFDYSKDEELKLCWNFTNLRIEKILLNKNRGQWLDVLAAKNYFQELFDKTGYKPCLNLLNKIAQLELSESIRTENQQAFIRDHNEYLEMIENYSEFEFELLNSGRDISEVKKEIEFLRKAGL